MPGLQMISANADGAAPFESTQTPHVPGFNDPRAHSEPRAGLRSPVPAHTGWPPSRAEVGSGLQPSSIPSGGRCSPLRPHSSSHQPRLLLLDETM